MGTVCDVCILITLSTKDYFMPFDKQRVNKLSSKSLSVFKLECKFDKVSPGLSCIISIIHLTISKLMDNQEPVRPDRCLQKPLELDS